MAYEYQDDTWGNDAETLEYAEDFIIVGKYKQNKCMCVYWRIRKCA